MGGGALAGGRGCLVRVRIGIVACALLVLPVTMAAAASRGALASSRAGSDAGPGGWQFQLGPVSTRTTVSSDGSFSVPIRVGCYSPVLQGKFSGSKVTFSASLDCTLQGHHYSAGMTGAGKADPAWPDSTTAIGTWAVHGPGGGSGRWKMTRVGGQGATIPAATAVITGKATIVRADGSHEAASGTAQLGQGDTVSTGAATAKIILQGGQEIFLGDHSEFKLEQQQSNGFRLSQLLGTIYYKLTHTARSSYQVRTTTAVIAVRGTIFTVTTTGASTQVQVYDGTVEVSNRQGTPAHARLTAGQQTTVTRSGPPSRPGKFTAPVKPFWSR